MLLGFYIQSQEYYGGTGKEVMVFKNYIDMQLALF